MQTDLMNSEFIRVETDSRGVVTVTLNKPQKHNAFDDEILKQLNHIFQSLGKNEEVKVVVLAAEGKSFSAGADVNWMKRIAEYSYEENLADAEVLAKTMQLLNDLPQPTIAKVQGSAYGGAVGLIACCDIVVSAENAEFCLSEVKIGLIPAVISPYVIDAIGARAARRYFISAETFTADEACALGLVSQVCTREGLGPIVDGKISCLLENSPAAIKQAKKLIKNVQAKQMDTPSNIHHQCCEAIAKIRVSEEGQEGLRAFLEKRSPSWKL